MYDVKDLMMRFGVGQHTVLEWINSGQLVALRIARKPGKRPKFRITEEALKAFELSISTMPPPSRTRRKRQPADVLDIIQ